MPKIICAECKAIEDVEEAPSSMSGVLCSACKARGPRQQRSPKRAESPPRKRRNIPRKQHGTRVMLPIKCSECGKLDTLDYVPKGADFDDVLCKECAAKTFGDKSEWAKIEGYKQKDAQKDQEWEFHCDECGRKDILPFQPQPDRTYLCSRCHHEHETPSRERIAGRERAAGGVFIRRKSPDSSDDN